MPRDTTASFDAKLASGPQLYPRILVKLEYDTDPVLVWNGIGELVFNSETYQGVGDFGSISAVSEPAELGTPELNCILNGIPSTLIADALAEPYQGRPAFVFLAMFDSDHTLTDEDDVDTIFAGTISNQSIVIGGEESSISVSLRSYFAQFERAHIRRFTTADWQSDHPLDKVLNFVNKLAERDTVWQE